MITTSRHLLAPNPPHYVWDNSLEPKLTVSSGQTVTFETRDAADEHFSLTSTTADVATYEFRGHPLTGPVFVEGTRPGSVLQIEVLEVQPASFGWDCDSAWLRPVARRLPVHLPADLGPV